MRTDIKRYLFMWLFENPIAYIVYALVGMYFLFIWLPYRNHLLQIGFEYGWPRKKHAAIIKLFREGKLLAVGYTGMTYGRGAEFSLIIAGPWGQYVKSGFTDDDFDFLSLGQEMPPEVAKAFEGYISRRADCVYLLWNPNFAEKLQKEVPDILTNSIWDREAFALWKKDYPFVLEVKEGDPLKNTLIRVEQ